MNQKVHLITGAASGIGAACAKLLHERGDTVVLTDIQTEQGAALAAQLGNSLFLEQDTRDPQVWDEVLQAIAQRHGRLDGLINNAGIAIPQNVEEVSKESYDKQMDINVYGVWLGMQKSLPYLQESKGNIVNVSSVASLQGAGSLAVYCGTKGAVSALTRAIAHSQAIANTSVRCNAVCPGIIDTPIWESILEPDSGMGAAMKEQLVALGSNDLPSVDMVAANAVPGGAKGTPDQVARAIAFLLSDDASYVNGQCLPVDYGLTSS